MVICRGKVWVSGGFLLLLSMFFWMDSEMGGLFPALAACFLHEMGHVQMARRLKEPVKCIKLTAVGAELHFRNNEISYQKDLLITLAGPVTSLFCAWVAAELKVFVLAGMCLGQGIFNLLPIYPLDGGRVLSLVLMNWRDGAWVDFAGDAMSLLSIFVTLFLGFVLLWKYGNPSLGIVGCWLFAGRLKIQQRKRKKHLQKGRKCGNIPQSE